MQYEAAARLGILGEYGLGYAGRPLMNLWPKTLLRNLVSSASLIVGASVDESRLVPTGSICRPYGPVPSFVSERVLASWARTVKECSPMMQK